MSHRQAWDHLRLRERSGTTVAFPFLELDEELWDRSGRRLTVFIDPGRVKRGVAPLEDLGPSLRAGHEYLLEIDPRWEDAGGRPLLRGFSKEFRVAPADRESPDPAVWKIAPPRAGTREPLAVTFGEPLDHGLLHSNLMVESPDGSPLEGEIQVRDHEASWSFLPERPWAEGGHHLVVATTLEDLAGNSVGKPFEVDELETVQRKLDVPSVKLGFHPLPFSN